MSDDSKRHGLISLRTAIERLDGAKERAAAEKASEFPPKVVGGDYMLELACAYARMAGCFQAIISSVQYDLQRAEALLTHTDDKEDGADGKSMA